MLVYDHPFSSLFFENNGPAPSRQFVFAACRDRVFLEGRGGPGQVAVSMNLGVIIYRQLCAFVTLQDLCDAFLVFRPVIVFQRCDIKEQVLALIVVLGHVSGVERTPTVQYFLQVFLVWSRRRGSFLLFSSSKGGKANCENTDQDGQKALAHRHPPIRRQIVAQRAKSRK